MTGVPTSSRPDQSWRVRIFVISHLALAAVVLTASAVWFRASTNWIAFPAIAIAGLLMEQFPLRSENLSNGTVLNVTASDAPALAAIFLLDPFIAALAAGLGPMTLDLKDRVRPRLLVTNVAARMIFAAIVGMIVRAPLHRTDARGLVARRARGLRRDDRGLLGLPPPGSGLPAGRVRSLGRTSSPSCSP